MKDKLRILSIDVGNKLGSCVMELIKDKEQWKAKFLYVGEKDYSLFGEDKWYYIKKDTESLIKEYEIDFVLPEKSNFGGYGRGKSNFMKPIIDVTSILRIVQSTHKKSYPLNFQTWSSLISKEFGNRYKNIEKWERKKNSIDIANTILKEIGFKGQLVWKAKTSKYNQDNAAEAVLMAYVLLKHWPLTEGIKRDFD